MIRLDRKDRRILYELDIDSRQSFNKIAKKVKLSKDSVIYRIRKMQSEGIIKRFHTVIDVGRLGFISFRLYLKLQNTTPDKEREIIEFLKKKRIVTWLVSIEGEYDVGMWILTKSIAEMNDLWKKLLEKYRDFIEKRWLTIFAKVSYFPRTYILDGEKNTTEFVFITEPNEVRLNHTDISILKMLSYNSRISVVDISKKLKISSKTVTSRIRELENKKVIIGYRTMFDIEKLGYQYFKIHFNLHNKNKEIERQLKSFFKQHPNVTYDNEVLGGDDIEIDVQIKSLKDLRNFLDEVKKRFAHIIKNYTYMSFYEEHKYLFFPV